MKGPIKSSKGYKMIQKVKKGLVRVGIASAIAAGTLSIPRNVIQAQIVPDSTLPSNSAVTSNGNSITIDGGTTAGTNLFHSFREFAVPTDAEAFFNNAPTIDNIITRVTGSSVSNIDGLIRANGTANLFLLNPNGIVFGPNARLNIGGSFISSTADSLQFADGSFYSATNPNTPPLLTVNVPVGLQWLGQNRGEIRVLGNGNSMILDPKLNGYPNLPPPENYNPGFAVKPGNTLALVGGNVTLNGGILTAESGRIEIGAVSKGLVTLNPTTFGWNLDYVEVQDLGDINFSTAALANASGNGSGGIQLVGRNLTMSDGSLALIDNQGNHPPGRIEVKTSSIELSGNNLNSKVPSGLLTRTAIDGQGADIAVSTQRLRMTDGAYVYAFSLGDSRQGRAGNVTVNATEFIEAIGYAQANMRLPTTIASDTRSQAAAGNVIISTARLRVSDGADISATTYNAGRGGNVTVNAQDVEVIGFIKDPRFQTRSGIVSRTQGSGNSGTVSINAPRVAIGSGGVISSTTGASGASGSVSVNASESVQVSGVGAGTTLNSSLAARTVANTTLQRVLGLPPIPAGDAGSVTITTPRLIVSDRGAVSVDNQGFGKAGSMQIFAGEILLDRGGRITASTFSGEGGNVNLQVARLLQLSNGSQITAAADNSGNGGNLTINANTIVALENSDISANAVGGAGGNIQIATMGIFGTQFRSTQTPESDITASSQFGVNGTVTINTPEIDPSSGLVELSGNFFDPNQQIVSGCIPYQGSSFTITGRGGIPPDPTDVLHGQIVWHSLRPRMASDRASEQRNLTALELQLTTINHQQLTEANGWIINPKGEVELVAAVPDQSDWSQLARCQDLSTRPKTTVTQP